MPFRPLRPAALAAAVVSLSLVAGTTAAGAYDCEAEVNRTLQEQGVRQDNVELVKLVRRSAGANPSSNYTLDAWSRLKRSEEHTSELQSLMRISYAVFCLKKKTQNKRQKTANETKI